MFLFSFRSYFVVFFLLFLSLQGYGQTTYTVNNSTDSGAGSLRDAINYANSQIAGSITNITFSNTPLEYV